MDAAMESYTSLCRLCLATVKRGTNLFKGRYSKKYSKQLKEMFQIELKDIPKWPLTACNNCIQKLKEIKKAEEIAAFKKKIASSQKKLIQLVSDTRVKCEPVDLDEPLEETGSRSTQEEAISDVSVKPQLVNDDEGGDISDRDISSDDLSSLSEGDDSSCDEKDTSEGEERSQQKGSSIRVPPNKHIPVDSKHEKMLRDLDVLQCQPCDRKFTSFSGLNKHDRMVHNKGCSRIRCCGVQFWGRREVYDHMQYHSNKEAFKCRQCGNCYMCDRTLQRHKAVHSVPIKGEFKCKKCEKEFKTKIRLEMHQKYHLNPKKRPLKCPKCDKRFMYKSAVTQHLISAHHENKEPSECGVCGKLVHFLSDHMKRKHTPAEELKSCWVCKKKLPAITLVSHMKRSHSKKEFPCTKCERVFKTNSHLTVHTNRDHLGVLHSCAFCPVQFKGKSGTYSHYKLKHPAEWAEIQRKKHGPGGKKVPLESKMDEED